METLDTNDVEWFKKHLGKRIRQRRIEKALTLEELAEKINGDDKHLGKVERGNKLPSAFLLAKIQVVLELKSDDYLPEFEKKHFKNNKYKG